MKKIAMALLMVSIANLAPASAQDAAAKNAAPLYECTNDLGRTVIVKSLMNQLVINAPSVSPSQFVCDVTTIGADGLVNCTGWQNGFMMVDRAKNVIVAASVTKSLFDGGSQGNIKFTTDLDTYSCIKQ